MEPYIPEMLPLKGIIDCERLLTFVARANMMLGRYDGLLCGIVNPTIMLSPLMNEEAVLSSRIEGTQATVDEVLEHEAGLVSPKSNHEDIKEIINYRKALLSAQKHLEDKPVSMYLIREMHRILLDSVRGQNKSPGEVRNEQNWIGPAGCSMENASFIPPDPMQLSGFLENWEQYARANEKDAIIQAGVLHAQFEMLHPFKDGNGRLGRILIPLFLYQKKVISRPMFYLSSYLEGHRDEYYLRLRNISSNKEWNEWLEFFLNAVTEQAVANVRKAGQIMALYEEMKGRIQSITHSRFTVAVLDSLFWSPVFNVIEFAKNANVPRATVTTIIRKLKKHDIVKELKTGKGRSPSVYCFHSLLDIVKK
ncbi:Fic family protein [Synergistes jonesii]|uniref:Cell filamentation protein Fic n=1 Tax=Synergistes jonesii TaxID=2754 RepID=A0A073IN11_9BACT|nr:Fic/DOC family N-terminal domain-containing protein [Synergistes jonesii]KEJ91104.1 cell filamentation protein Fic [Synergistes jonesii]OFB60220.1 cell filamentation protein Fic [Synergistes jonesii]OFB60945.1 cell filamentation protein Fic [Synergistes jonesii]OFB64589.1 cell filamentation protein Fic [Synergistes jonesii]OFB66427.1 cell filamentation protein Fic [Synergistes jonesii]